MAITTMDQLLSALSAGARTNMLKISQTAEGAGTYHSLWKAAGLPTAGVTPATTGAGEFPTDATLGSVTFTNAGGTNTKYIGRVSFQGPTAGTLILYDRLWQNSGLLGNITTTQNINSSTPTRYSNGIGVEIFGEVYTAMGASASTLSVVYTDSTGGSFTGTYAHPANALSVGQMFPINPPVNAIGIKTITSATFSATTGTAGNFGLVLVRRIAEIPIAFPNVVTTMDAFALGLPEIQPDACLATMVACTATNTGNIFGSIDLIEG